MAICPVHKKQLKIESKTLAILGVPYQCSLGSCVSCKNVYINRKVFSSCTSFDIDGVHYEYLDSLEKEIPPLMVTPKHEAEPVKKSKKQVPDTARASRKKSKNESSIITKKTLVARYLAESSNSYDCEEMIRKIRYSPYEEIEAKTVVFNIPQYSRCAEDDQELVSVNRLRVKIEGESILTHGLYCVKCGRAYFSPQHMQELQRKVHRNNTPFEYSVRYVKQERHRASVPQEPLPTPRASQNTPPPHYVAEHFDVCQSEPLYVCKGIIKCRRDLHKVISKTGIFKSLYGADIRINVNYCPQCGKHFISYDEYSAYKKKYGVILGNIKSVNGSFVQPSYEMADESPLHLCGYTVSQNVGLSDDERHAILAFLIASKILRKPEVIEYINGFIRLNGSRWNMSNAVKCWREDLEWVRRYRIDSQQAFEISKILKNR